ncbi:MAG: type IV pilus secretin PilQ [Nitrospinae bacterium]|nr:type IV pilus secretin PilQ [Nitrospinota bacterium]
MITFPKRLVLIYLALPIFAACAGGKAMTKSTEATPAGGGVTTIRDLSAYGNGDKVEVSLDADGPIQSVAFKLMDPPRLIVDLAGADMSLFQSQIPVNHELVKNIRPYYFAKSNDSRLELELNGDVDYKLDDSTPKKLKIVVLKPGAGGTAPVAASSQPAVSEKPQAAPAEAKTASSTAKTSAPEKPIILAEPSGDANRVTDVRFIQKDKNLAQVEITMSKPEPAYELLSRANMNRLTINLPNTVIEQADERLINVALEGSKVKNVAAFQFRGGKSPMAKIVVNLEESQLYNISSQGSKITLDIGDETVLALATEVTPEKKKVVEEQALIGTKDAAYTGARISLDFQKADIHNIFRIIAYVAGLNIITSEKVKATVTLKLKNVPWDQALDVILRNNGLDKTQDGNIIRVATMEEVSKEKETVVKARESEAKIIPLFTRVFNVNYEAVDKLKKNLESIKSERGSVEVNERTNTIIAKDMREKLAEMASLIEKLDKKEPQVLIEAKIISATRDKVRGLGIQWGGYANNTTALMFPHTVGVTGGAGVSPNVSANGGGTGVNLPIASGAGGALGAIGLTLGAVNGTALLDAKLMAMEQDSEAVIISNPKITTMNNKKAMIKSGQQVPYTTTSAEGTKTEFKDAVLLLEVTPHITPDKHMRLSLKVTKDRPLPGNPPPIEKREAETEVLIADGETAVLGGLFEDTTNTGQAMVPGLGRIPFLGWLFKNETTSNNNQELLIFITPKIVD